MTKMTYGEQLRHPFWQRKRLQVLEAACWACESCGDKASTLHVHHRRYVKGRMAWEYEERELQALCEACHGEQHQHRELLEQLLMSGSASYPMALGLLAGYLYCADCGIQEDLEPSIRAISGPLFIEGQVAALMSRVNWRRIGEAIQSLIESGSFRMGLNPAEQEALNFLLSQPEPATDL